MTPTQNHPVVALLAGACRGAVPMTALLRILVRALRCCLGWCGGHVVSGIHPWDPYTPERWIWIGWRCATCGKVAHYEPSCRLSDMSRP